MYTQVNVYNLRQIKTLQKCFVLRNIVYVEWTVDEKNVLMIRRKSETFVVAVARYCK